MTNLPIILEISIQWSIWLALYYLLLRRHTFFSANRMYLLGTLVMGMVLPFVHFQYPVLQEAGYVLTLPEITIMSTPTLTQYTPTTNWISIIYKTGVTLFSLAFLFNIGKLLFSLAQNKKQKQGGFWLVELPNKTAPFSFFNYIFVFRKEAYQEEEWNQILLHEQTHGHLLHSLDILFVEILKIVFWFNPLIYLYKIALRDVHEFQADNATTQRHNKKEYSRLLFRHTQSGMQVPFTSNFISSQLKKRIKMLTNKRSNPTAMYRYLLALPLLVLLFFVSCTEDIKTEMRDLVDESKQETLIEKVKSQNDKSANKVLTPNERKEAKASNKEIKTDATEIEQIKSPSAPVAKEVYRAVEEMPIFEGCTETAGKNRLDPCTEEALLKFIYSKIQYPKSSRKAGVEGRAIAEFIVNTYGKIEAIRILRSADKATGEEVIRVLNEMNGEVTWKPGKKAGVPVKVQYILPVMFKLQ